LNFLKGQLVFEKDFEIQFTPPPSCISAKTVSFNMHSEQVDTHAKKNTRYTRDTKKGAEY